MPSTDRSHPDRAALERVELAFPELVGDHEVLERELVLDGRPLGDWLARAPGGRLLVSVVDGTADAAVLRALDGLAVARTRPELLGAGGVPVRVVLVALDGFSGQQLERLVALGGDDLWLLRRRELSSARGTHTRLEALDLSMEGPTGDPVALPAWALRRPFHEFLAGVVPDRLELALELLGRLRRVDPGLTWSLDGATLLCASGRDPLAALDAARGGLQVELDDQSPVLAVEDRRGLDAAVEAVLAAHLARLAHPDDTMGQGRGPRGITPPPVEPLDLSRGPRAHDPEEPDDLDDLEDFDDDDLPTLELRPVPPGPLLTPEEIRAFQE
jgi:hypothetical protein